MDSKAFEVELREAEGRNPVLIGTILQEGRAATGGRAELFAPGSVEWPGNGIGISVEHRGKVETRGHVIRRRDGGLQVNALATEPVQKAVQEGKRFMSVEFRALEERTTAGGVREIQRAFVDTATLTARPEYDSTKAEIRSADDVNRRARVWL